MFYCVILYLNHLCKSQCNMWWQLLHPDQFDSTTDSEDKYCSLETHFYYLLNTEELILSNNLLNHLCSW